MHIHPVRRYTLTCLTALGLLCAAPAQAADASPGATLLASPVRPDKDRQADARRQPLELLKFAQVAPGMKVLDIASGGGYTAQVLALAVGPTGKVWAQVAKPSAALEARLAAQPQANLEILTRPFEDLTPPELPPLDVVTLILSYHDIAATPVDRAKMNAAIFKALKPGGHLVVMDHSAKAGAGITEVSNLHRIDEQTVRTEFLAAGFKLDGQVSTWANPADTRQEHSSKMATPPSDRVALRFVRID